MPKIRPLEGATYSFPDMMDALVLLVFNTQVTRATSEEFDAWAATPDGSVVEFAVFGSGLAYEHTVLGPALMSGEVDRIEILLDGVPQVEMTEIAEESADYIAARQLVWDGTDPMAVENLINGLDYDYRGTGADDLAAKGIVILDTYEFGPAGDDRFNLGDGKAVFHAGKGDDVVRSGIDDDTLYGGGGDDKLRGGGGDDLLKGGSGKDRLRGEDGDDVLKGGKGRDRLDGGRGADRLDGGAGDDRLDGGRGDDTLKGGQGADSFLFRPGSGIDRIVDFTVGEDVLLIDDRFWEGDLDAARVVGRFAREVDDDVVFRFGEDELVVEGIGSRGELRDSVEIV